MIFRAPSRLLITEKTASTSTGLVEAFPSLNDGEGGDFPEELISMKMTPDGTKWWLIGQMGQIREVRRAPGFTEGCAWTRQRDGSYPALPSRATYGDVHEIKPFSTWKKQSIRSTIQGACSWTEPRMNASPRARSGRGRAGGCCFLFDK